MLEQLNKVQLNTKGTIKISAIPLTDRSVDNWELDKLIHKLSEIKMYMMIKLSKLLGKENDKVIVN